MFTMRMHSMSFVRSLLLQCRRPCDRIQVFIDADLHEIKTRIFCRDEPFFPTQLFRQCFFHISRSDFLASFKSQLQHIDTPRTPRLRFVSAAGFLICESVVLAVCFMNLHGVRGLFVRHDGNVACGFCRKIRLFAASSI